MGIRNDSFDFDALSQEARKRSCSEQLPKQTELTSRRKTST